MAQQRHGGMVSVNLRAVAALLMLFAWPSAAVAQSETIEYYGLDALGSVRTIFDQQGNLVARMD